MVTNKQNGVRSGQQPSAGVNERGFVSVASFDLITAANASPGAEERHNGVSSRMYTHLGQ